MNTRTILPLLALAIFSSACQPVAPTATFTPTVQATHPATVRPSPTATATPMLEPTATLCAAWPALAPDLPFEQNTETSPNGQWTLTIATSNPVATACSPTGEAQYVKVAVANGAVEWKLIEQWENYGLGAGRYAPLRWSEDGERLYFTYAAMPDGCQGLNSHTGLWQANLKNGAVTEILGQVGFVLGLLPSEAQVMYARFGARELTMLEIATQTETSFSLPASITSQPEYTIGQALWAPDENGVLVNVWLNFCSPPFTPENTALVYVPFTTGQAEILFEDQTQGFLAQAWPELDKVQVRDKTGAEWWLNPQTGALTQP